MWPFKSIDNLGKSGMFEGFTDWHSHILPGVDDGIRTMEESLETLAAFEENGIRKVWLTPHIMEDVPNTTQSLRDRFAELKEAYKGGIELCLASENMLDNLFEERLKAGDILPIGNAGRHLLVETSYINPPYGMDSMIEDIFAAGLTPVLAHPERYRYMDDDAYHRLKERGVLFQANYVSLVGGYGESARRRLEWLLKEGYINLTGSDVHRKFSFDNALERSPKHADPYRRLLEVARNPILE